MSEPLPDPVPDPAAPVDDAARVHVSTVYLTRAQRREWSSVLSVEQYKVIEGAELCAHAKQAVVVYGRALGEFVWVCAGLDVCTVHWSWEFEHAGRPAREAAATEAATQRQLLAAARRRARVDNREAVLARALMAVKKQGPIVDFAAVLRLLAHVDGRRCGTWRALILDRLTLATWDLASDRQWTAAAALWKAFGVSLPRIERALTAPATGKTKGKPTRKGRPT